MLDIFHRDPSYGVVLVALECHLSSLHVLCLHRRYTALHQTLRTISPLIYIRKHDAIYIIFFRLY